MPENRDRQQHFALGKPIAGVYDNLAKGPAFVIEQEICDGAKAAIRCSDLETL